MPGNIPLNGDKCPKNKQKDLISMIIFFFWILVGIPTSNIVNTGRESHIYYLEELWQAGAD